MTDEEIRIIKERCERATPGPWKSYIEGRDHESGSDFIMTGEEKSPSRGPDIELTGATDDDQDFIAHARQDVPRLLAEVERLRRVREEGHR
jgi:hypothetical protein